MTLADWLAWLLAAAVAMAAVRLVAGYIQPPVEARARPWRLAILLALQPLTAALLYLTLLPPPSSASRGTLVVLTRNAPFAGLATRDRIVALPEAPALPGVERVPDLATALRRSAVARLRVIGDGLEARDRDAVGGTPIDYTPPPLPSGLIRLDLPPPVAAGSTFRVGGRVNGVAGATVELIDPGGRRVDGVVADKAGDFVVEGAARISGPALFRLQVRSPTRPIAATDVPVWTTTAAPQRVLLLPGAPDPEVKYLRRWASDAGLVVHSRFPTGDGLELGDAPVPLNTATLGRYDLAVLDERSWTALSPGERAAVIEAVRGGLGLIVRLAGPLSAPARSALQPLGFAVSDGSTTAPVTLRTPADDAARQARAGPGTRDAPAALNRGDAEPPLTRWAIRVESEDATPLLRDAHGATVALRRAEGEGRVALWPLADSYRLVLAGRGDRFGELWSSAFAIVGRGQPGLPPAVEPGARVGERVALCGIARDALVVAPDGDTTKLLIDPSAGPSACAAFWPSLPGWHRLQQGSSDPVAAPFFVATGDALPGVRALADREATLQLAATPPATTRDNAATIARHGRSWPWFLAWLAASAVLWWFERARFGRASPPRPIHNG